MPHSQTFNRYRLKCFEGNITAKKNDGFDDFLSLLPTKTANPMLPFKYREAT